MNKIDRDRSRRSIKSKAFDISAWTKAQEKNQMNLSRWFLERIEQLRDKDLSKWEVGFVEGLFEQIINKARPMTSKQAVFFDSLGKMKGK